MEDLLPFTASFVPRLFPSRWPRQLYLRQKCLFCSRFVRVSDGTRTRDRRDHNPELYQLSYAHHVGRRSLAPDQPRTRASANARHSLGVRSG